MLVQYTELKRQMPDSLLFFQVGDFYELFFEDAVTVSRALNLTLTSRDKNNPEPVPMCGVPIAVVDGYVDRLVALGFSAALVSQREQTIGGKTVISRKLDRIVTPGIRLLANTDNQYASALVAAVLWSSDQDLAVAVTDVQSGRVVVRESLDLPAARLELARLAPSEVVVPNSLDGHPVDRRSSLVRDLESASRSSVLKLRADSGPQSGQGRSFPSIAGYSTLSPTAKRAVRLLVNYVDETTVESTVHISEISVGKQDHALVIDAITQANLELVKNARDGSRRGTLYEYLDRTVSSAGARLLRAWILQPLLEPAAIRGRLEAVRALKGAALARARLRERLNGAPDLERIAARLELDVASPRELGAMRDLLAALPQIRADLGDVLTAKAHGALSELSARLTAPAGVAELLERTLVENPPPSASEGGMIKEGFDPEVDRLRSVRNEGHSWMDLLEAEERKRTGIGSLRIRNNSVLGYFIEVTRANLHKVPPHYVRRQSTANSDRFTTPDLTSRQTEVMGALDKLIALERKLFEGLRRKLAESAGESRELGRACAELDTLASLAELAEREQLAEPVVDDSRILRIVDGRHPVLSAALQSRFIANSIDLADASNFAIITGPNMGGKSTFLRQCSLIVIMAQIGSYVSAESAHVGVTDRIFARIGASDDIHEGESTFMVEMKEAANIIANATERSLLVIDEIGRGTTTSDGLAIAQAILEWLVNESRSRSLFATHFHELTAMERQYPAIVNLSVGSIDRDGEVIFTHRINSGPANRSYGLEVAKLAGLPYNLLARAKDILAELEAQRGGRKEERSSQLSIFGSPASGAARPAPRELPSDYGNLKKMSEELRSLDPDRLTPLQALHALYSLKEHLS